MLWLEVERDPSEALFLIAQVGSWPRFPALYPMGAELARTVFSELPSEVRWLHRPFSWKRLWAYLKPFSIFRS